ncbi:MAG: acyltransferase family protein [Oscillospiraceae bacterium]|nr:acyltransferase family protein [Oscillospiraceae bacterium]
MTNQKRLDYIDIAKGIGIILVVFAHTLVPQIRENSSFAGFLWIFIYNFHMPLFFFLSGWLFEKGLERYNNKVKFILGKLEYLMLPYLTFSVFAYVFINSALKINILASVLKGGGYAATPVKEAVFQIITYNEHIDQHLWFVFSLFIVFLINILFPKLMKSKPTLILLLILYVSKAFVHYYGILDYTASDLLFFSLARVMYTEKKQITLKSPLSIAAAIAVFITSNCIYSYFYVTGMPGGALKAILYIIRSVSSVSGISLVCTLSEYISSKPESKLFKETGLYSYDIYLMHAPFLVSGSMGILLSYSSFPAPVCCAAVLVIGITLPYVISRFIIRKIPPLSVMVLGKK